MPKRPSLLAASAAAVLALTGAPGASATVAAAAPPARAASQNVLEPGPFHRRLDPLVGTWKAVKYNYLLGRDGEPVVSRDLTVRTRWIAETGGRFLREESEGTLGGNRYYRLGVLGFSGIDRRYEWTTFDSVTPTSMTYRGPALAEGADVLTLPGSFTDPGVLGPEHAGRTIPMRTVITIRPGGRHTFDLYFTPPGQAERLVDRVVYLRRTA
ncbi:DUF1579 family protein [Bailinhaonella thermotolerans]|uniref:DUF1579 domain-containing protein n=1 Tax=Bailinhaonella thermotolerans TaxID=1070861 RepID=A0A3A4AJ23_9ACTN|nr:DUF1579 family protein [Bailinhaonella thermotolerans]RJL27064.1 DUF1579 domain-containing protein [Bailinhaonella thermotolerans]